MKAHLVGPVLLSAPIIFTTSCGTISGVKQCRFEQRGVSASGEIRAVRRDNGHRACRPGRATRVQLSTEYGAPSDRHTELFSVRTHDERRAPRQSNAVPTTRIVRARRRPGNLGPEPGRDIQILRLAVDHRTGARPCRVGRAGDGDCYGPANRVTPPHPAYDDNTFGRELVQGERGRLRVSPPSAGMRDPLRDRR
jgi:hypothetical protein